MRDHEPQYVAGKLMYNHKFIQSLLKNISKLPHLKCNKQVIFSTLIHIMKYYSTSNL